MWLLQLASDFFITSKDNSTRNNVRGRHGDASWMYKRASSKDYFDGNEKDESSSNLKLYNNQFYCLVKLNFPLLLNSVM